ncbi:MAG: cysteine dioxygenase [Caulobacteraceae bacterium]|nr:cysteine dioxygenase [Caulobacteraceae bacterium]
MSVEASSSEPKRIDRLRDFVVELGALLERTEDEAQVLDQGGKLLEALVAHDDWLPDAFAQPSPERYQQYLLHCDSQERFSVVSFVWGPGQATPIHDHTVWGLIGVLRGAETSERFAPGADGPLVSEGVDRLEVGQVDAVSPTVGDIHRVSNAFTDRASISIHVYGANIGAVRRSTFDAEGRPKRFISGYANSLLPNLWDRSNNPAATVPPSETPALA